MQIPPQTGAAEQLPPAESGIRPARARRFGGGTQCTLLFACGSGLFAGSCRAFFVWRRMI